MRPTALAMLLGHPKLEVPRLLQDGLRAGFQPPAAQVAGSAPPDSKAFGLIWNRPLWPMGL